MSDLEMISPDEMLQRAKVVMLDGRSPINADEWQLIINYVASKMPVEMALQACVLMKVLYAIPLDEDVMAIICTFQEMHRKGVV